MLSKIDTNKSVPREQWGEFFDQFSNDNRGRRISINSELGDEELIRNAPLMAMIYDRPGKGDNLSIEVGKDELTYGHTVSSQTDVLTGQNSTGVMIAVQISDAVGTKTLIQLQAV